MSDMSDYNKAAEGKVPDREPAESVEPVDRAAADSTSAAEAPEVPGDRAPDKSAENKDSAEELPEMAAWWFRRRDRI